MFKPSVRVKQHDGFMVAEFWDCYRLEPGPVQDLKKQYESHLANGGTPGLAVDLSGVGFAGSSALGGFVSMRKSGVRIVFFQAEPVVREVFRVGGLDRLFLFVNDEAAAVDELRRGADQQSPNGTGPTPANPGAAPAPRPASAAPALRRTRKESD